MSTRDQSGGSVTLDEARAAKAEAASIFEGLGQSVAIGITRIGDGYGLKVNFETAPTTECPSEVNGVPVRVEVVGRVRKRAVA